MDNASPFLLLRSASSSLTHLLAEGRVEREEAPRGDVQPALHAGAAQEDGHLFLKLVFVCLEFCFVFLGVCRSMIAGLVHVREGGAGTPRHAPPWAFDHQCTHTTHTPLNTTKFKPENVPWRGGGQRRPRARARTPPPAPCARTPARARPSGPGIGVGVCKWEWMHKGGWSIGSGSIEWDRREREGREAYVRTMSVAETLPSGVCASAVTTQASCCRCRCCWGSDAMVE